MAKKNMKSENEGESKSKSKSKSKSENDLSKKKNATKGKRPALKPVRKEESFASMLRREKAALDKSSAIYEAEEAKWIKIKIQRFKEECELLGYSFIPSEKKLVDFYLRRKNSGKEIAYCPIEEVDINANHLKGLIEDCRRTPGKVGYFFTRSRLNEIQSSSDNVEGHWIFTEKEDVLNQGQKLGVKQVFEYWEGDHSTGYKIIEYQLDPAPVDPKAWFICKLWKAEGCRVLKNQS